MKELKDYNKFSVRDLMKVFNINIFFGKKIKNKRQIIYQYEFDFNSLSSKNEKKEMKNIIVNLIKEKLIRQVIELDQTQYVIRNVIV